ncbi:MAG: NUDIX hydrolase [Candidatus Hodarchaeales archaeon]|jgi:ADP-ribose pyrophosphatase YjhB (NUDIX family)
MVSDELKWQLISSNLVKDYKILRIVEKMFEHPLTREHHPFLTFESSDWVNVIPLTPDFDVVMIEQFRAGIKQVVLEIPGGLIDPGDTALIAAKRELEEETGYLSEKWIYLGETEPNPALFTNSCHTYLALDCSRTGTLNFDSGEMIKNKIIPLETIPDLIGGKIKHALIIVAFQFLFLKYPGILLGKKPDPGELPPI